MPWVVGIDEAGYGPNLGPLVQCAVAVDLPADDLAGWRTTRSQIRRAAEPDDGRVLVDDSKKVYAGAGGFLRLEQGFSAILGPPAGTLGEWLGAVGLPWTKDDVEAEHWHDLGERLPLFPCERRSSLNAKLIAVNVVPTVLFNRVVAGSNSKATLLSSGLIELLKASCRALPVEEPLEFFCDKHGGRNFYGPMLQGAFPDGWPIAEAESADESRYRIEALDRPVRVTVRPRADSGSIAVALASMVAKYVREVSMGQFNRFWLKHVPDLPPTAGYPVDAKRFYAAIRPAMERMTLEEDRVWRCR